MGDQISGKMPKDLSHHENTPPLVLRKREVNKKGYTKTKKRGEQIREAMEEQRRAQEELTGEDIRTWMEEEEKRREQMKRDEEEKRRE